MATKKDARNEEERQAQKRQAECEIVEQPPNKKRRGIFLKEIKQMMYGFGDSAHPLRESVEVMEDVVYEFITDMMKKAMQVAARPGKVKTEDLVYLIRKDSKKYARTQELLYMEKEIKAARKILDVDGEAAEDVGVELEDIVGGEEAD